MKLRKLRFSDSKQLSKPPLLKKLKLSNLTKALMGRKSFSAKHVSQIPLPPANLLEIIQGGGVPKHHSSDHNLKKGGVGLRGLFLKKKDGVVSQAKSPSGGKRKGLAVKKKQLLLVSTQESKKKERSSSAEQVKDKKEKRGKEEPLWFGSLRRQEEEVLSPEVVSMMRPFSSTKAPGINFISADTVIITSHSSIYLLFLAASFLAFPKYFGYEFFLFVILLFMIISLGF